MLKQMDIRNGMLLSNLTNDDSYILHEERRKRLSRAEKRYKHLSDEQYVEIAGMRHVAFKSLSKL